MGVCRAQEQASQRWLPSPVCVNWVVVRAQIGWVRVRALKRRSLGPGILEWTACDLRGARAQRANKGSTAASGSPWVANQRIWSRCRSNYTGKNRRHRHRASWRAAGRHFQGARGGLCRSICSLDSEWSRVLGRYCRCRLALQQQ
jgi:hypothetical protein